MTKKRSNKRTLESLLPVFSLWVKHYFTGYKDLKNKWSGDQTQELINSSEDGPWNLQKTVKWNGKLVILEIKITIKEKK